MKIGTINFPGFAALAPMAGVADRAMRQLCIEYGAAYAVSELVSSKGVSLGDKKSGELLNFHEGEKPIGAQLFGSDPTVMAAAAKIAAAYNPTFIDINMGCPAPKISSCGGGSALMKTPSLAAEIVKAVVAAIDLPVTVKIRSGWDKAAINAVEVAKYCEDAGAAAITVHGRTREQMYAPPVNFDIIRKVKESVSVPVIGNGDISSGPDALHMYKETGCDFVMVGRAAMGKPWIFSEINAYLSGKEFVPPTLRERLEVLKRHVLLMSLYKDPHIAMLEARKHAAWYLKGLHGATELRRKCSAISSMDDLYEICQMALELQPNETV